VSNEPGLVLPNQWLWILTYDPTPIPSDKESLEAIGLTIKLATLTTILLLLIATPLAWWLARTGSRWRALISALVTLPLVLPPSVLGFYLLLSLGPQGLVGQLTQVLGLGILSFTFTGLLIGSVVFSLPFAVQPMQHAFEALGKRPMEVAATLGASPRDAFFTVALPQARAGVLTAAILSFAHTVGEFGVALMVGGNIPGRTRVVSTQIYGYVEAMEYPAAHLLAGGMLLFSFIVLFLLARLRRQQNPVRP
jgi:molybdate transport system permease protein